MSEQVQSAAPVQEAAPQESQESSQEQAQEGSSQASEGKSEAIADAKATATDPNASKEEKKAAEKLLKKYQIKVDGKVEELELDLNDDESVKKHLQMSKAASKKMQEASDLRKAAEEFITMLRTNPRKVLSDPNLNVDLKKIAEEYIQEEIERASKSPEQLEKEKLQKELEELKSKYEKDENERKEKEFKRLQAEQEERIQTDIEVALKESELPKSPYTVRKMAELMMMALQNNIDLSPKDLVPLLRNQVTSDIKDLFSVASDDVLESFLGKDVIGRIRKRQISKVAPKQSVETASQIKATGASEAKSKTEEAPKKISMRDFLKG